MNSPLPIFGFLTRDHTGKRTLAFEKNGVRRVEWFWNEFEMERFAEKEGIWIPMRRSFRGSRGSGRKSPARLI